MIKYAERLVLQLVANCLNRVAVTEPSYRSYWNEISAIAKKHSILSLVLHASITLSPELRPPDDMIVVWKKLIISSVMRNEQSMQAQASVISKLQSSGIRCAVLKGTSVAALYPKAEMRTLGDIDILVRRDQCDQAVAALISDFYETHESDHSFHIGFHKAGAYLELHYAMSQLPVSPIGEIIDSRVYDAVDRAVTGSIEQYAFPILVEPDQALSLLLHMERHLISEGIGLRQLCDWCVFVDSLSHERLHNDVLPVIRECQLFQFASILTRICVDHLGLDGSRHQWCMHIHKRTADELLADIMDSGNIMSRDLERAASSTFVKGEESADGKQSMLSSATKNLTQSAKKQFPICNKLPILLPVFWVYIPIRYLYRSMKGTRPKQSVSRIAKYAIKRKRLYRKLELFKK